MSSNRNTNTDASVSREEEIRNGMAVIRLLVPEAVNNALRAALCDPEDEKAFGLKEDDDSGHCAFLVHCRDWSSVAAAENSIESLEVINSADAVACFEVHLEKCLAVIDEISEGDRSVLREIAAAFQASVAHLNPIPANAMTVQTRDPMVMNSPHRTGRHHSSLRPFVRSFAGR